MSSLWGGVYAEKDRVVLRSLSRGLSRLVGYGPNCSGPCNRTYLPLPFTCEPYYLANLCDVADLLLRAFATTTFNSNAKAAAFCPVR